MVIDKLSGDYMDPFRPAQLFAVSLFPRKTEYDICPWPAAIYCQFTLDINKLSGQLVPNFNAVDSFSIGKEEFFDLRIVCNSRTVFDRGFYKREGQPLREYADTIVIYRSAGKAILFDAWLNLYDFFPRETLVEGYLFAPVPGPSFVIRKNVVEDHANLDYQAGVRYF